MSGGQQQRVALARALVNRPTVLLLDEPLGALDLKLRKEMQLELKALQREVGITFVYVTHDQEEALTMSDVIVVMRDGLIQQQGEPTELYERPGQPVRRRLHRDVQLPRRQRSRPSTASRRGRRSHGPRPDPAWHRHRPQRGRRRRRRGDRRDPARAAAGRPADGRSKGRGPGGHAESEDASIKGPISATRPSIRVQTEQAGESSSAARTQRGPEQARALGPGDPVVVRWQEEANLVLAGLRSAHDPAGPGRGGVDMAERDLDEVLRADVADQGQPPRLPGQRPG